MRKPSPTSKKRSPEIAKSPGRFIQQEQAGITLYASKAILESIFRVAPSGIGVTRDRVLLDVNRKICEMTGYTPEELIGQSARVLYPSQEEFDFVGREKYAQITKTGTGIVETRWQRKDGTLRDILLASTALEPSDLSKGIIFTALDITERKQAEQALRESEDKFKYIFDHSVTPKSITLVSGEINVNHAFCRMLGYSQEELKHRKWQDITHPEDIPINQSKIQALISGEREETRFTKRYLHKNGSVIWTEVGTALRRDPSGKPLYFLTTVNDITLRKKTEDALLASNAYLQAVLDSVNEAVFVDDADTGKIIDVNQRMCEMYGYSRAEALNAQINEFSQGEHPYTQEEALRWLRKAREAGPQSFEWLAKHKNGHCFWVEVSICFVVIGGQNRFVVVAHDITERKNAEKALRESEAFSQAILKHSPIGISVRSQDGQLLLANEAWQRIWAIPENALREDMNQARSHLQFDSRDDYLSAHQDQIREIYERGGSLYLPDLKTNSKRPNAAAWVSQYFYAIRDENDQVNRVVILTENSTKRKEAEEAIRRINAELERRVEERTRELREAQEKLLQQERLATLGRLAGEVGFELRNPLGVISNAVYYLKMTLPQADKKIKEYLDILDNESRSASQFVSDLVHYSNIQPGDRYPASASDLVSQALEIHPIPDSVRASANLAADLPRIFVDSRQVSQALGNILLNAIQAMPQGGQLQIDAGQARPGDGQQLVWISISDTGVGIPLENMPKIFEPLFSTKARGIGLGLAISQKLIQANGGQIEVHSEPGKGATFTVFLPVKA
jgi:PAS domain S-box-containing protein